VFRSARRDADTLVKHLRALTNGIKELKSHRGRRAAFFKEHLETTAGSLMENNISAFRMYAGAASWGQTLVFVVIGLYLFVLPRANNADGVALTGYTLALLYLMTPLQVIMNLLPQLGRANVALLTVQELGFTLAQDKPEILSDKDDPLAPWQRLELKSVTHAYRGENESESFMLGPIDLTIKAGETIFVIGGNGSGKTTLIKLIVGLYSAENGHIYLDRTQIQEDDLEKYRQNFSVVFADSFLFEDLLGLRSPDLESQAQDYLLKLKLAHKVNLSNGKLSTIELSQGQRKRLALLTAYLENRPIYVFDEWAADQDPYFKDVFYTHLLPELKMRGKTVIVISHDDRYFQAADRIIKLDEGRLVSDSIRPLTTLELASDWSPS
jgi:putative pyoverdin transport system ATP-binding/permease protein